MNRFDRVCLRRPVEVPDSHAQVASLRRQLALACSISLHKITCTMFFYTGEGREIVDAASPLGLKQPSRVAREFACGYEIGRKCALSFLAELLAALVCFCML